jgi:hypothetical protein
VAVRLSNFGAIGGVQYDLSIVPFPASLVLQGPASAAAEGAAPLCLMATARSSSGSTFLNLPPKT